VTLARAFTTTFSGIAPGDVPAFVAAQIAGALLASGAAMILFSPNR
jgi:glycerol uptake facilitator-like aquaporin